MKKLWLMFFVLSVLFSCKKDNIENISNSDIEGIWKGSNLLEPEEGHRYEFVFCNGDFQLKESIYIDVAYDSNGCYIGEYDEYIRGNYTINDNYLFLEGFFTDSLFVNENTGCYRTGKYKDSFKLRMEDPLVLKFQKDDASIYNDFTLNLIDKVSCNEVEP